jgi:hypothetical protein
MKDVAGKYMRLCMVCHEHKHPREFRFRERRFLTCRNCRDKKRKRMAGAKWRASCPDYLREYWAKNGDKYNRARKEKRAAAKAGMA